MFKELHNLRDALMSIYPSASVSVSMEVWRFASGTYEDSIRLYAHGGGAALSEAFPSLEAARLFVRGLKLTSEETTLDNQTGNGSACNDVLCGFTMWILKPREDIEGESPWNPCYDKAFGFIVSARTEEEARRVANAEGGDECGPVSHNVYRTGGDPWLDPKLTKCEPLKATDKAEVIMRYFASA